MRQKKWVVAVTALMLSACGGGGGGTETDTSVSPAQQAPGAGPDERLVLAAPVAVEGPNRIALSWTAPGGLANFSVWLAPDGTSEFKPIATDLAGSQRTAEVARGVAWKLDFPTARIRLRGCDADARCADSNEQPLRAALMGTVVNVVAGREGGVDYDNVQLSTDGNTFAVRQDFRHVGIYHRDPEGRWHAEAVLDLPLYGSEVRLSGDGSTVVVEYNQYAVPSVLVFVRDAMHRWSQQAVLKPDGPLWSPWFGRKLAISEDGNLVATSGSVAGENDSVRVFVFARDGAGRWSQDSMITEPAGSTTPMDPVVGLVLSPNGRSIAVTAFSGVNVGTGIGSSDASFYTVRVYRRDCKCHTWRQQANLRSDRWPYPLGRYFMVDAFGLGDMQFDEAGTRLVVGAPQQPPGNENYQYRVIASAGSTPGAVYVFDAAPSGVWQKSARIDNVNWPRQDFFGANLSLSRDGKVLAASTCGFFSALAKNRNHPADWDASDPPGGDPNGPWECPGRTAAYVYSVNDQGDWVFKTSVIPFKQTEGEQKMITNTVMSGDAKTLVIKRAVYRPAEVSQYNYVTIY